MADWIDSEADRRKRGVTRALTQSQHAAVNARYPGATQEECDRCASDTGKAGRLDGSLYLPNGEGPLCDDCYDAAGGE